MNKDIYLSWVEEIMLMNNDGKMLTDTPRIIANYLCRIVGKDITSDSGLLRYKLKSLNVGNKRLIDKNIKKGLKKFLTEVFLVKVSRMKKTTLERNVGYHESYTLDQISTKICKKPRFLDNIIREIHEMI